MAAAELRKSKRVSLIRFAAFAFLIFAGIFTWAFLSEARRILRQTTNSWTDDVNADCAVVLTGGPNRVREGVDLLARKNVQKLIISGVNPQATLREIFFLWPYYGGMSDRDLILEKRSRTTYGNAQQTLPLVEALRCRDLVLITSRVHMRRAVLTFKAEFPPEFPIIPRAVIAGSVEPSYSDLFTETIKSLFYATWAY